MHMFISLSLSLSISLSIYIHMYIMLHPIHISLTQKHNTIIDKSTIPEVNELHTSNALYDKFALQSVIREWSAVN